MECSICGKPLGAFSKHPLRDGVLCGDCFNKIPEYINRKPRDIAMHEVRGIFEYWGQWHGQLVRRFQETAHYGHLHLDETHGLFALGDKSILDGDRLRETCYDVFPVTALREVAIATNPRDGTSSGKVVVDVSFAADLAEPAISLKTPLKSGVRCPTERVDASTVKWVEPGDLSMFRNVFYRAYEQAYTKARDFQDDMERQIRLDREQQELHERQLALQEKDALVKALHLYMLERDNLTEALIKQQRRILLKAFHPDASGADTGKYIDTINNAYERLMKEV